MRVRTQWSLSRPRAEGLYTFLQAPARRILRHGPFLALSSFFEGFDLSLSWARSLLSSLLLGHRQQPFGIGILLAWRQRSTWLETGRQHCAEPVGIQASWSSKAPRALCSAPGRLGPLDAGTNLP